MHVSLSCLLVLADKTNAWLIWRKWKPEADKVNKVQHELGDELIGRFF